MAENANNTREIVSKETLLETGIQFGHPVKNRNPK
jgi:ribosomal protein S2